MCSRGGWQQLNVEMSVQGGGGGLAHPFAERFDSGIFTTIAEAPRRGAWSCRRRPARSPQSSIGSQLFDANAESNLHRGEGPQVESDRESSTINEPSESAALDAEGHGRDGRARAVVRSDARCGGGAEIEVNPTAANCTAEPARQATADNNESGFGRAVRGQHAEAASAGHRLLRCALSL